VGGCSRVREIFQKERFEGDLRCLSKGFGTKYGGNLLKYNVEEEIERLNVGEICRDTVRGNTKRFEPTLLLSVDVLGKVEIVRCGCDWVDGRSPGKRTCI